MGPLAKLQLADVRIILKRKIGGGKAPPNKN
jgi:hypothetical protein